MKATNLAALLALFAVSSTDAADTFSAWKAKASAGLSSFGSSVASHLSAAKEKVSTATTQAVTSAGYNRVNTGFVFKLPKPLGAYLTPETCPAKVNALEVLFAAGESGAFDGKAPSTLYCPAALTSLSELKSIDLLLEASKPGAKVENALLALMYRYVRLHGNYKPRHIQNKFNECMAFLKNYQATCAGKECTATDLDALKTALFENADYKSKCSSLPTMEGQVTSFIEQLKKDLPNASAPGTVNVQTLKTPQGISSAFNKAASSSSFYVSPLLLDRSHVAARENIRLLLTQFKAIRGDLYAPAETTFKTANGQEIVLLGEKKPEGGIKSSIQADDFKQAEGSPNATETEKPNDTVTA